MKNVMCIIKGSLPALFLFSLLFSSVAFAQLKDPPSGASVYELKKTTELPDNEFDFFTGGMVVSRDLALDVFGEPVDIRNFQGKINAMSEDVSKMLTGTDPALALNAISQYLFGVKGYKCEKKEPNVFKADHMLPFVVLSSKVGDPLSLASIYLAIADRLGVVLWGLEKKDDFYLYYQDADKKFFVDLGNNGEVLASLPDKIQKLDRFLDEKDGLTHKNILAVLIRELSAFYIGKQKLDQAVHVLQSAEKLSPGDASVYELLGEVYQLQKKTDQAVAAWGQSIGKNPQYEKAYSKLAIHYLNSKEPLKAIELLHGLDVYDPGGDQNGLIAIAYASMGNYEMAAKHFEISKKAKPNEKQAYINLAKAYSKAGKFDKVAEVYEEAIRAFPDDPAFYVEQANEFLRRKKTDELIAYAQKALALNPGNTAANALLAIGYEEKGEHDKAVMLLEQAMDQNPKDWRAYAVYGGFLMENKNFKEARGYFKKAIKRNEDDPHLLYQLGLTYYYEGNALSAQVEFEKGLKRFTLNDQALFHMGLALTDAHRKKFDNAIKHYEIAKKSGHENPGLEERFARYRATGK